MSTSSVVACRWDWCRSTFPSIDALDTHVKHDHIWPMKPMRKAEIALMRRMDLQSLHSSLDTDSSINPKDLLVGVSRSRTPPPTNLVPSTPKTRKDSDVFDTFTQLSSPPQTQSPERLPASPAFESLVKQGGPAGLSAAVEMFERTHRLKTNRSPRLLSHSYSPMLRPRSDSSGSSQAVEQQLTQEGDLSSQSLLTPEPQTENEPGGRPLADNGTEAPKSQSPESQSDCHRGGTLARGQRFRSGSLNVLLRVNSPRSSRNTEDISQESAILSQPLMSQANYPSQTE